MDPLSALSIAAAVGQFADLGGRLLKKTWSTFGPLSEQEKANVRQLSMEVSLVKETLGRQSGTGAANQILDECDRLAFKFQQALDSLGGSSRRPFDRLWNNKEIRDMEKQLDKLMERVKTTVLLSLWYVINFASSIIDSPLHFQFFS